MTGFGAKEPKKRKDQRREIHPATVLSGCALSPHMLFLKNWLSGAALVQHICKHRSSEIGLSLLVWCHITELTQTRQEDSPV
jgi:hypothetical protein